MIDILKSELAACTFCEPHLPLGAKPIFNFSRSSKIILVSQAPGLLAHKSGVAYQDPSGVRLRAWLGVDEETFYNDQHFAIMPMGFCYPGKGKSGDLPPRKECAPLWHDRIWSQFSNVQLILLIGQYAQKAYLKERAKRTLTLTVKAYAEYLPQYFPVVHPSPRNRFWHAKNGWFEEEVIPELQRIVREIIKD
ncbi:MAG: uracil-DNA glycosylase family protein [Bacteroidota bacterium]